MLDQLSTYWQFGTVFCSIEVTSLSSNEKGFFAVTAKKKKGEFAELQFETASDFDELAKELPKNQHCFITLSPDKVLIKKVPLRDNLTAVLSDAFPGLSLDEFYYEVVPVHDNCFVMVCRKEYVNTILKEASKANIHVLGFHLGFSQAPILLPFVKINNQLSTARYKLEVSQETIMDYSLEKNIEKGGQTYDIEGVIVSSNYMVALSGLFRYINKSRAHANIEEVNTGLRKQFGQWIFFKKGSRVAIGFLLLVLLVNFFVFNSYFQEKQRLDGSMIFSKSQKKLYAHRLEAIKSKEKTVNNILRSGNSNSTFYLNRVVASKPNTIQLQELTFQPLEKAIRPAKEITYQSNTVKVAGESNDKPNFSNWIEALEQNKWVTSITVLEYGNTTKGINSFEFLISMSNDTEN